MDFASLSDVPTSWRCALSASTLWLILIAIGLGASLLCPGLRVRGLVDDLVALPTRDQYRRPEVGTEVLHALGGGDRHVDLGLRGVRDADPRGLSVGELDLVGAEEPPGVHDRQGDLGVI